MEYENPEMEVIIFRKNIVTDSLTDVGDETPDDGFDV